VSSAFSGLNTALTALVAQRRGLDVAGQNIANANTDGYSRQRADLRSVVGTVTPAMYSTWQGTGSGVVVADVTRIRDAFLDARNRTERAGAAYLTNDQQVYGQVERLITEPSDTGLQAQLADVWASWHDVSNNPGDLSARNQLLQQSTTVATTLNQSHQALAELWSTTRQQLGALVDDVNATAASVAQLNQAIVRATAAGLPASELADRRDELALHLADLTGASVRSPGDGSVQVLLGGQSLVSGPVARQLAATGAAQLDLQAGNPVSLQWADGGAAAVTVPSGQIGSVLATLTGTVPGYSARLDAVAANLASAVNTQHAAGYDLAGTAGGTFFTGSTAASITVAITDPALVAASGTPGGNLDGGNADAMAALSSAATGPDVSYRQLVADLGTVTHSVNQRTAIQSALADQAGAAVSAYSGVSLDEEMTNMLSYQRAYQAAARVMSTVDSTLDTLINLRR
jgi:flagellar hook-associated protein 1 FlgK